MGQVASLADEPAAFLCFSRPRQGDPECRDDGRGPTQRAQVREESERFGQGRDRAVGIARHEGAPAETEVGEGDRPSVPDGPAASDRLLGPGWRSGRIDHGQRQPEPHEQSSRFERVVDLLPDLERSSAELERLLALAEISGDGRELGQRERCSDVIPERLPDRKAFGIASTELGPVATVPDVVVGQLEEEIGSPCRFERVGVFLRNV